MYKYKYIYIYIYIYILYENIYIFMFIYIYIFIGSDKTLRLFNTALEAQNREMSQNVILKKLGLRRRNERLPVTMHKFIFK
jgi:hypothetical protein